MNKTRLLSIVGGSIGFVIGIIGGAYLGLVVGGTFLGRFDIYKYTGFEGYELAAYVGAMVGALVMMRFGIRLALRMMDSSKNKI